MMKVFWIHLRDHFTSSCTKSLWQCPNVWYTEQNERSVVLTQATGKWGQGSSLLSRPLPRPDPCPPTPQQGTSPGWGDRSHWHAAAQGILWGVKSLQAPSPWGRADMNLSKFLPQRLGKKALRLKKAPQPCEYFCVQQNYIFLMLLTSPALVIVLKCHEGILNTNSKQLFRLVMSPFFFDPIYTTPRPRKEGANYKKWKKKPQGFFRLVISQPAVPTRQWNSPWPPWAPGTSPSRACPHQLRKAKRCASRSPPVSHHQTHTAVARSCKPRL